MFFVPVSSFFLTERTKINKVRGACMNTLPDVEYFDKIWHDGQAQ